MPARLRIYLAACGLVAVGTLFAVAGQAEQLEWQKVVGFALLSFLAEQLPVEMAKGYTYSVSFVLTIAAIVSAGPLTAVIAALCGTISLQNLLSKRFHRHLFNASQLVISSGFAGLTYLAVGGPRVSVSGDLRLVAVVLPLLLATLVNFAANTALVSQAIALSERRPWVRTWMENYRNLIGTYVAFAFMGLVLGILYVRMGWAPVVFLLMPLLVARQAFQAAITMQSTYDSTVRSLITAIEAKDKYTRGHAERVSRLAEMTARAYGLSEERCRAIRYAALMHDVGKLTVQSKVLQKPGKLTPEEYDHMKIHPLRGVEILSEIELLEEAMVGVRHHHERIDGKGYPDGLKGEEIPLIARLITVSDAFDSMTSTRTYRRAMTIDAAYAELDRCSGEMFDPDAIAALKKAVARNGWTPTPELPGEEEEEEVNRDAPKQAAL